MKKTECENTIRKLISKNVNTTIPVNDIPIDLSLYSVGIDSLSLVKIIVDIEDLYNIRLLKLEDILEKSATIKCLCKILSSELNKKK